MEGKFVEYDKKFAQMFQMINATNVAVSSSASSNKEMKAMMTSIYDRLDGVGGSALLLSKACVVEVSIVDPLATKLTESTGAIVVEEKAPHSIKEVPVVEDIEAPVVEGMEVPVVEGIVGSVVVEAVTAAVEHVSGDVEDPYTMGIAVLCSSLLEDSGPKEPATQTFASMKRSPKKSADVVFEVPKERRGTRLQSLSTIANVKKGDHSLQKFCLGQKVWLLNPKGGRQMVAIGNVSALAGGLVHFCTIREGWCKVDVNEALHGDVLLMEPNEDAEQLLVKDVVKGNTLWEAKFMKAFI